MSEGTSTGRNDSFVGVAGAGSRIGEVTRSLGLANAAARAAGLGQVLGLPRADSRITGLGQVLGVGGAGSRIGEVTRSLGLLNAAARAAGLDRSIAMAASLATAESRIAGLGQMLGLPPTESRITGLGQVLGVAGAETRIGDMARSLGLANGAFMAPFSALTTQALFGRLAEITSNDVRSSFSVLENINVDQIVEDFSSLAREDRINESLYRERVRQLWASYVYIQVWIIVLLVLLGVFKYDETLSSLLGIGNMMTEVGGKSVAYKARKIALETFDRTYPSGSEMPTVHNLLF
jgi:hypothetical protein